MSSLTELEPGEIPATTTPSSPPPSTPSISLSEAETESTAAEPEGKGAGGESSGRVQSPTPPPLPEKAELRSKPLKRRQQRGKADHKKGVLLPIRDLKGRVNRIFNRAVAGAFKDTQKAAEVAKHNYYSQVNNNDDDDSSSIDRSKVPSTNKASAKQRNRNYRRHRPSSSSESESTTSKGSAGGKRKSPDSFNNNNDNREDGDFQPRRKTRLIKLKEGTRRRRKVEPLLLSQLPKPHKRLRNMEQNQCPFCLAPVTPNQRKAHIQLEHKNLLFVCTDCDEDDGCIDSSRFERYDDAANHVRNDHNVTSDEGICSFIKIPASDHLRAYKCILCSTEFVGTTADRVISGGHFETVHKVKKVRPNHLKRMCRICGFASGKNEDALLKHILDTHPRDDFACDDDDDDEEDAAEEAELQKLRQPVVQSQPPAPPPAMQPQPTSTSQRIQINLERNTQKSAPKPQQPQQQMVPRQVAMSNNVSHVPPPQQQQAQQHFQQPPQQQQLNPLPVPVPVPSSAYMHLNPQQPQAAMPQPSSSGRTVTMMHQNPPQIPLDASDLLSPKLKKRRVSPSSSDDDSSSSSSSEEMRKLVRKLTKKKKKKDKKKKKKKSRKRSRSRDEYEDEDEDEEEDEEVEEEDEPDPRMDKIFREQQSKATTVFIDRDKVKRTVMVKDEDMEYFNKLRASKEHSVSRTDISPMRVKPLHHHRGGGGGDNNRDLSDGEIREGSRSPHHHNKPDFSSALSRPNQQPPPLKFDLSEIKKRVKSEEKEPRRARSVDSRSSRDSSYRDRKYYDRDGRRSPPSHGRRRRRSSDSRSSRSRSYSRSRSRSRSRSYDDGEDYCDDCHVPLNESNAYDHYNSKMHHMRIRNKIRCYLCSKYVDNPKMHLEHVHARDVFQCKGSRCTQPKFLDLVKILNHIDDKHPEEARMCSNNDDLIRRNMITIPQNLSSYKCKLCNRPFVGQPLKKVLQHQRWEDGQKEPDLRDIYYFCRICGGERSFTKDEHLQDHCKSHSKLAALAARSSPGSRPPPPVHRPRDGYYGGGGYYRRDSRDRGYGGGGRFRYDHRDRYRRASYSSSSRSRSRSPRSHREEGDRRSRVYVPCVFCPQVTENSDKDKKYHYDSNHRNQMFTCKPCKEHGSTIFRDIDRKVILEHIRRQHPDQPAEEEQVLKHSLVMPDDMKIIFCYACKNDAEEKKEEEGEAKEEKPKSFMWLCQDVLEVEPLLHEHREKHHKEIQSLSEIIRLGCRGCDEHFNFDFEFRRKWKDHVDNAHSDLINKRSSKDFEPRSSRSRRRTYSRSSSRSSRGRRRHSRSESSSRSRSRSRGGRSTHSVNNGGDQQGSSSGDLCYYCCDSLPPGEDRETHVRQEHVHLCFACKICPDNQALFEERDGLLRHIKKEHGEETPFDAAVITPKDLRAVLCMMCQRTFYGVGENEMKKHFLTAHKGSEVDGFLDRKCRLCMQSGQFDDDTELVEHLVNKHGADDFQISPVESDSRKEREDKKEGKDKADDEGDVVNDRVRKPAEEEEVKKDENCKKKDANVLFAPVPPPLPPPTDSSPNKGNNANQSEVEKVQQQQQQQQQQQAKMYLYGASAMSICIFCPQALLDFEAVRRHMIDVHLDLCFKCKLCHKMACLDMDSAKKHLKDFHGESVDACDRQLLVRCLKFPSDHRRIQCLKCPQVFLGPRSVNSALTHLATNHGLKIQLATETNFDDKLILSCRSCSARMSNPPEFDAHILTCFATASNLT